MSQLELHRILRQIRLSQGLSVKQVAKHLGMTSSALSHKEKGNVGFTLAQLDSYADLLGYELTFSVKRS